MTSQIYGPQHQSIYNTYSTHDKQHHIHHHSSKWKTEEHGDNMDEEKQIPNGNPKSKKP